MIMNIAIFCPNWIGDVVMATPALRALRRHFHRDRLIGVYRPYIAGVLEGAAWFNEVILSGGKGWGQGVLGTARRLRPIGVDLALLLVNSFRSALTAWLGGCERIVGYARGGRSWLLTEPLPSLRGSDGKFEPSPVIDAYDRLAEHVGCPAPGYRMKLATTESDERAADRVWRRFGLDRFVSVVALNPGAAYGSAKLWSSDYFAQLAQRLADERGAGVLVLCGPAEVDLARQIVTRANRPGVCGLNDEPLSLGLTKACVRRADLLVTTDSGPRHFAAAFDRPVVTLFGPTHIAWTETHYAKAVHLQKAVECGPCQRRVCPLDHRCMTLLTPAEVYEKAVALLARFPRSANPRGRSGWLPLRRDANRKVS